MSATSITPAKPALTTNDSAVLQALFDAESSPSSGVTIDQKLPSLPAHLNISEEDHGRLQTREKEIIAPLASSSQPSPDTLRSAISALDDLTNEYPTYPSAYANRAQILRMLLDETEQPSTEKVTLLTSLLSDLEKSITLSTPPSPASSLSPFQAKLLADTHTHRGYILLKISKQLKTATKTQNQDIPDKLKEIGSESLEEMASHDFFLGGRYGNKVAQQMAVQTNPYAKMCGAIVKEAMREEVKGI